MNAVDVDSALRELRDCGVDEPEQLLKSATPERIVATCQWWRTRTGVTTGLLVSRIRKGGVEIVETSSPLSVRRRQEKEFAELAGRFPLGRSLEPHARLQARRYPKDELCGGEMIVDEVCFPSLFCECDGCGFGAGYPLRTLKKLANKRERLDDGNDDGGS